jgi:hypothetical protein
MKAWSPVLSALCLAFGLVSPNQVYGEAGCFVVEVMMDQQAAPQREPVDQQASAERESTSSVHPRGKVKPVRNAQSPASPSLADLARVKAFMSGQSMADYCGDTKIVEGDESGQYRLRK